MPDPALGEAELVPIDEVARRLGLRASAIRYYEERGLVDPAARHSGRRWYGPAEVRRLAIIRYWQECGLMSLDEIGDILAGAVGTRRWAQIIRDRIEALDAQIRRMQAVRQHLEHIAGKHEHAPDGCPYYEALIWDPPGHGHPVPAGHGADPAGHGAVAGDHGAVPGDHGAVPDRAPAPDRAAIPDQAIVRDRAAALGERA